MKIIAKTIAGVEELLAQEIQELGGENIEILRRAVSFEGRKDLLYKANYCLRTAIRVLVHVKSGEVNNQKDLYDLVESIKWSDYFDVDKTLAIDAVATASNFNHSNFVALKAKDAIVDQFRNKFGKRPNIELKKPDIRINVQIYKDQCNISLDSTGESLHLRKYKTFSGPAPVSEVLAAAIIDWSHFHGLPQMIDPMCGSGTFTCEAIMKYNKIPARYFNPSFSFQHWKMYDQDLWEDIKQEADDGITIQRYPFIASDADDKSLSIAKSNFEKLKPFAPGLKLKRADYFDIEDLTPSTVFLNPPYDDRIKIRDINEFYGRIGTVMKHQMKGSNIWLISGNMDAIKKIGLKPSSKRNLFNGPKPCKLHQYEIFEGKLKAFKFQ